MVKEILITVAVLGGLGLIFGLVLALASRVFAVKSDPRKDQLMEIMPGANCGACGFAGCSAYADAVVGGAAEVGACPVGGAAVAEKMAAIMGVSAGAAVRKVAMVRCTGGGSTRRLYRYEGKMDCQAASRVAAGGPLACQAGCLGFGSCVKVCDFGAISVRDGCAVVDREKCMACKKCVSACPRNLIAIVPYDAPVHVMCSSKEKGVTVRAVCGSGCIGCSLCTKVCPSGAITVANNLASIDPDKCTGCGACMEKCPQHVITRAGEIREPKAEAS